MKKLFILTILLMSAIWSQAQDAAPSTPKTLGTVQMFYSIQGGDTIIFAKTPIGWARLLRYKQALSYTDTVTLAGSGSNTDPLRVRIDTLTDFNKIVLQNDSGVFTKSDNLYWDKANGKFQVVAPINIASDAYFGYQVHLNYTPDGADPDSVLVKDGGIVKAVARSSFAKNTIYTNSDTLARDITVDGNGKTLVFTKVGFNRRPTFTIDPYVITIKSQDDDNGVAAQTVYDRSSINSNVNTLTQNFIKQNLDDDGYLLRMYNPAATSGDIENKITAGLDTLSITQRYSNPSNQTKGIIFTPEKDAIEIQNTTGNGIVAHEAITNWTDTTYLTQGRGDSRYALSSGSTVSNADSLGHHPPSYYLDRANHTGLQAESTITGLVSDLAGKQATLPVTIQRDHVIYTMGDSFTANGEYQTQLNTSLSGAFKIVNMGISGGLASGMNARFSQVTGGTGEYVIILGGINDIIQGQTASQIETSLQAMYTAAHNAGLKVVAMNIPSFGANANWTSGLETIRGTVNTWISATATNIDYKIDIETALWDPSNHTNLNPTYDSGDGLHPNTTGYDLIGTTIYAGATFTPSVSTPTIEFAGNFYVDQNLGTFANVTHKNLNLNTFNVNGQNLSAGQASSNFASGADGTIAIIAKSSLATQTADILQVQDNAANVSASFALTGQSLKLTPLADATKGLLIKEFSGTYSANPLEIQNSSGTILWRVNNTGLTATTGIFNPTSANNSQILLNAPGIAAQVNTATATDAFSINQQNSSATGNILSLKFAGTAKAQFGIDGRLGLSIASPLAGLDVHTPITATSGAADGVRTTGSLTPDVNGSILSSFTSLGTYQTGASAIAASNVITGGSGGTNGTYGTTSVPIALTGGTGTGASAIITVSGNAVTAVTMVQGGTGYTAGDVISASSASIGNVTGFSFTATVGLTGVVRLNAYFKNQPIAFASISTPSNFISGSAMLFYTSPDLFMRDGATTFNLTHPTTLGTVTTVSTFSKTVATTPADEIISLAGTAAAVGAQQYSPGIAWNAFGWGTTAGTSQALNWRSYATATQSTVPTSTWNLDYSVAGGAYSQLLQVSSSGGLSVNGGGGTISAGPYNGNISALATTSTDGGVFSNRTAATVGVPVQYSPRIRIGGRVYNTTPTAASNEYDFGIESRGVSGTTPTAAMYFMSSLVTNTTPSFTDRMSLDNSGNLSMLTGTVILKGFTVSTLPTGVTGMTAYVTDALTPASLTTVVGGGAQVVPVFYNGTNWIVQ